MNNIAAMFTIKLLPIDSSYPSQRQEHPVTQRIRWKVKKMLDKCHKCGCSSVDAKSCGACGVACYCSVECQKEDWQLHKRSCLDIKNLPTTLLPLPQVQTTFEKGRSLVMTLTGEAKNKKAIILFQKLLAFVEHQYGRQIPGSSYCVRSSGDEIDHLILINIRIEIMALHGKVCDIESEISLGLTILSMLSIRLLKDPTFLMLTEVETNLALAYGIKGDVIEADKHCEQSLKFAKLIKGQGRISCEYQAMKTLAFIRGLQSRQEDAIDVCEKAYILVSGAHGPVHPEVQQAASDLIHLLTSVGDHTRAENYCRMNYDNLTHPYNQINQESLEVSQGMMQIADIWFCKDPIDDEKAAFTLAEEAEDMIKEAIRILEKQYRGEVGRIALYYNTYSDVLIKRGKYTDETRVVLERTLAVHRLNPAGTDIIRAHVLPCIIQRLADFHDHLSGFLPSGDERDRELKLRDKYIEELAKCYG